MKFAVDTTIVLTVGSLAQKQLCEKLVSQLDFEGNKIVIISDDEFGCRIGSGGAVLNAVERYYANCKKLLIINSGGFSKRTVNCAIKGKAFAQTVCGGRPVTMLELIYKNASRLSKAFSEGVLICCSDILADTKGLNINFDNNIGFGVKADTQTGTQHGVMFKASNGELEYFLHKSNKEKLCEYSKRFNCDDVIIDTGMVYLCGKFAEKLLNVTQKEKLLNTIKNEKVEINFYSDILPLLSKHINRDEYFENTCSNTALLQLKEVLFNSFNKDSMQVCVLENQSFLHFGTTRQLLENTLKLSNSEGSCLNINSCVDKAVQIGVGTVLENVLLSDGCKIGSDCLISDINFDRPVFIADEKAVCGIKLIDGSYVTVIADLDENPKQTADSNELWNTPRYYKGNSFYESLNKFITKPSEEKFSLKDCTENADFNYCFENLQYLKGMSENRPNEKYLQIRNDIISDYFKRSCTQYFAAVTDCVEISMPVRINLCGTWTDAMPYCLENGGEVINAAVTVDNLLPINVKLEKLENKVIEFFSDGQKALFDFNEADIDDSFSDFNLHKTVLKTVGITSLQQLDCGFRLSTAVTGIDKGSGLGTSSILLAACFMAFSNMFNLNYSKGKITETVFVAEQLMKTGGGWQDQSGGIFPSVKRVFSKPGLSQKVYVEPITIPPVFEKVFAQKTVLLPTGQRHFGRFIVNDVVNRYLNRQPEAIEAYREMKQLNRKLLAAISSSDVGTFYSCINRHMQLLKLISPAVANEKIDSMIRTCSKVSAAVSICGAGAGGYLLVFLKENVSVDEFRHFAAENFPDIKSKVLKTDIYNELI